MRHYLPNLDSVAKEKCPKCCVNEPNINLNNVEGDMRWRFTCLSCGHQWLEEKKDDVTPSIWRRIGLLFSSR